MRLEVDEVVEQEVIQVGSKKKKVIVISLVVSLLLLILIVGGYIIVDRSFVLKIIGDDVVNVGVNKNYLESGAIATLFDKKIDDIDIDGNVDVNKIGEYKVSYTAKVFIFKKEVDRTVIVKDLDKPVIELNGDKSVYLTLGEPYKEDGYTASDNIDGDITDNVVINSNVDVSKAGEYTVTYTVKDAAMNEVSIERNVEVFDNQSVLQLSVADFTLDNVFTDVLLQYDPDHEYDYFDDITFIGDSNVCYFYRFGQYFSAKQTWGKNNLNIAQINSSTFTTFINGNTTDLETALKTYKPKYLVASIGINTVLYMSKLKFLDETQKLIDNMKNNYPDTKLIFTSVLPVYEGTISANAQRSINEYNYYLLELCHKNKINFINIADRVKDETGQAHYDYFECNAENNCGFHLNSKGKEIYIDYIKHLDLGGN